MINNAFLFLISCSYLFINEKLVSVDAFAKNNGQRVFVSTPVATRKLVSECMTPNPKTVTTSTTVDDAMAMLLGLGVNSLPVLDNNYPGGKFVGIVQSADFLQKEAGGGSLLPMEGSPDQVEEYVEAAKRICSTTVGDVMTHNPTTIDPNESMRTAATIMAQQRLNQLAVIDDTFSLVGILTTADIMRDLLHVAQTLPQKSSSTLSNESINNNDESLLRP